MDLTAGNALQDTVTEAAAGGVDTLALRGGAMLATAVTITAGTEIENLDASATGSVLLNLTGNTLANIMTGNAAANTLDGGTGVDTLIGGAGDDTYSIDNISDVVTEAANEGSDLVRVNIATSGGSYTLGANIENATLINTVAYNLTGNTLNNTMTGNAAANVLDGGAGNDALDGGAGVDTLIGGAGDDTYTIDNISEVVTEAAEEGSDLVRVNIATSGGSYSLGANIENATLINAVAYNLTGNEANNVLTGNAAANVLDGGEGADTLVGGAGNDTYYVDLTASNALQDTVTEAAASGVDTLTLRGGTVLETAATITLGDEIDNLNASATGSVLLNLTGNALNNVITGNAAANILDGGAGADALVGGAGDDSYLVDLTASNALQDTVTEAAAGGVDTLTLRGGTLLATAATITLGIEIDNLNASATGSVLLNLNGNALNNVITGNAAANVIDGGAGIDTLVGGAGDDTYTIDSLSDVITEAANEGSDLVRVNIATAGSSYTLGENFENATLINTVAYNLSGNEANNVLTGNSTTNVLDGGAGIDTLIGGAGHDTYLVDLTESNALQDTVIETFSAGVDTLTLRGGTVLATAATITLGTEIENLNASATGSVLLNLTGNTLANTMTGNAAANVLDGGTGIDVLIGGAGNDTYLVDLTATNALQDTVTEAAAGGVDTLALRGGAILATAATITLGTEIDNLDASATGNVLLNLTGNALNNTITGNAAVNVLNGGAGNDNLDGGAGIDTLVGGAGDDTYLVDLTATNALQDTVTEAAAGGVDTLTLRGGAILATASTITLGAEIENLDASATGNTLLNLTGNTLNNTMTGNAAVNVLNGGAGNDTLDGGAGIDTLVGGAGNDTYIFGRGYETDTVSENDTAIGNTDIAEFSAGIGTDQLWLRRVDDSLEVSIVGTSDKLVVENWYLGSQYHIEQFHTADNKVLLDSQVETLVQAMASFSPPSFGQTELPQNYQDVLAPVIAANWQ